MIHPPLILLIASLMTLNVGGSPASTWTYDPSTTLPNAPANMLSESNQSQGGTNIQIVVKFSDFPVTLCATVIT